MSEFTKLLSDLSIDMLPASAPLLNSLGIPIDQESLMVMTPILKFLKSISYDKILEDYSSRRLSNMESEKLDEVSKTAIRTFYILAKKNGWQEPDPEGYTYTQNIVESIDDVFNKAINESRRVKRIILGAYLGSSLYYSTSAKPYWDNIFYISSIIDRLTFRQLCLISLIGNNFDDIRLENENLCITDKTVISELNDLRSQFFWQPKTSRMGSPVEHPIPLNYIVATNITTELKSAILIPEEIRDDYMRVIDSLVIKPINPSDYPDGFLMGPEEAIKRKENRNNGNF